MRLITNIPIRMNSIAPVLRIFEGDWVWTNEHDELGNTHHIRLYTPSGQSATKIEKIENTNSFRTVSETNRSPI